MAKKESQYICGSCGAASSSWSGKCYSCGEWNTLQENVAAQPVGALRSRGKALQAQTLSETAKSDKPRLKTGIDEVDTVLGGGVVAGSVTLIAGQPGIGKSTILLQLASSLSAAYSVLYVSGEESAHQVGLRANRLGVSTAKLQLATSTSADDIAATIAGGSYELVIVDSIQTINVESVGSAAGSVSQITNSTNLLTAAAKTTNTALIIVGHVTKEGSIASPK